MSILLGILTFILILVSVVLILLVLMQKAKNDGGAGAALGGGMTESAFGADTNNVLSKSTINATIAFFVLSFLLYLGHLYQRNHAAGAEDSLPTIDAPAATTSAPDEASAPTVVVPAQSSEQTAGK
ncbi:MAG: preprotein translocase subunit SecG [Cephaloticoccus sp.]